MPSLSAISHAKRTVTGGACSAAGAVERVADDEIALWGALWSGARLSATELSALQAAAHSRGVCAGEMVFTRHDAARDLVMLWHGDVGLGHRSANGLFQIERVLHGPAWLDASSAWLGEGYTRDARALSAATVLELPYSTLRTMLERQPALAMRLLATLAKQIRDLAATAHDLMHKDAESRLAAWLMQHGDDSAESAPQTVVHLHERKRDIAAQLGIAPETFSRVMRSLSKQGLISVAGYTVRVLDLAALQQLAS